jgi:uncharacterized repeat protein (TIGR03847 family)
VITVAHISNDEVYPVTRITAGSIGEPGRRLFILQAYFGREPVSWVIEKDHAVALTRAIPRLLTDVQMEYPELAQPLVAAQPNLELVVPVAPEFHVESIGLGYDRIHDLVVLTLADGSRDESTGDDQIEDSRGSAETHLFATRGQAQLLVEQVARVVASGRPSCPECGEPIDDFGHFCALDAFGRPLRQVMH